MGIKTIAVQAWEPRCQFTDEQIAAAKANGQAIISRRQLNLIRRALQIAANEVERSEPYWQTLDLLS